MTKAYKLEPAYIAKVQARYYTTTMPLVFIMFFSVLLISGVGFEIRCRAILVWGLLFLMVIWGLSKANVQQRKMWASYVFIMDETNIKRTQNKSETIEIAKDEISRIREYPDGNLYVESEGQKKGILILSGLKEFSTIRTALTGWHEFELTRSTKQTNISIVLLTVIIVSLLTRVFYTSKNQTISIAVGFSFLLGILFLMVNDYKKSSKQSLKALRLFKLLSSK